MGAKRSIRGASLSQNSCELCENLQSVRNDRDNFRDRDSRPAMLPGTLDTIEGSSRYIVDMGERAPRWLLDEATKTLEACAALRAALAAGRNGEAIEWALAIGVLITQGATRRARVEAGQKRGQQVARDASESDQRINLLVKQFDNSEELQDQFRSVTAFIASKTRRNQRTIQRRRKRLQQR